MSTPSWGTPPPRAAVDAVLTAAHHAADLHPEQAAAAIATATGPDERRWLAVAAVGLLGSLIRLGVTTADELRREVLRIAQESKASVYQVDAALEAIAIAMALAQGDLDRVNELFSISQVSVLDIAHSAAAIAGQTIAGCGGDIEAVFNLMRAAYDIEAA